MVRKGRNKTKTAIIVLAVLLAFSLAALVGTLIYNNLTADVDTTVTVPNNLIAPGNDDSGNETSDAESNTEDGAASELSETNAPVSDNDKLGVSSEEQIKATSIVLYCKTPRDNIAFSVGNMFPGDRETGYYGVQVAYHDKVTVHFKADVRAGYEKLAEVLKVNITLLNTGEVMYDGLMRDMPADVKHNLYSSESTTEVLYYEISAYLDTSVGNEYQNKTLIADFKWWVDETGNLDDLPPTGDSAIPALWIIIASISAVMCVFLLLIRRKEEDEQID